MTGCIAMRLPPMRRWLEVAFFLATSLLVTAPLFFQHGFLLLLDWAPVPNPQPVWDRWTHIGFPFELMLWTGQRVAGAFSQKAFLTLISFLAGYGAYRAAPVSSVWARVVVGLLMQFNPFLYSRMLTGQVSHVFGFALLPWWLLAVGKFVDAPRVRNAVVLALVSSFVMWASTHIAVMLVIAAVLLTAAAGARLRGAAASRWRWRVCGGLIVVILTTAILNAFWIVPALRGRPIADVAFARSGVTDRHILSFFTRADPQHGVLWNVAAMYGFWGDDEWRYVPQKAIVPYWFHLFWGLFALVAWGFVVALMPARWRAIGTYAWNGSDAFLRSRMAAVAMAAIGFFAFAFAVGVAHPWFKPAALWVYDHVPFARGLREPQKFVAILVLVYAFFAARGIEDLLARIVRLPRERWWWLKLVAPGAFLLIPLAYSSGPLWGFHGQLQPRRYPAAWFEVDRFLASDRDDFRVLFLPWHQYINLSFAGTVVVNPAEQFFRSKLVIAGDNMEFGSIYSISTRPESKVIEQLLNDHDDPGAMATTLATLNVKYVLLAEESDAFNYRWIAQQYGIVPVRTSPQLTVYENLFWQAPAVGRSPPLPER